LSRSAPDPLDDLAAEAQLHRVEVATPGLGESLDVAVPAA
jgi:hypothetical protein